MERRRSIALGLIVGAAVLALIAVPAVFTAMAAVASFSGCFLACSAPEPVDGALWTGLTLVLLALPVVAGLMAARVRSMRGGLMFLGFAAVLLGGYLALQRVI